MKTNRSSTSPSAGRAPSPSSAFKKAVFTSSEAMNQLKREAIASADLKAMASAPPA